MEKVIIVSNSKSPVLVKNAMMNFRREWPRRGARVQIDREQFEELCNVCPGFVYMLKNNLLYTDNLDSLKAVGLEDPDATKIENTKPITDAEMKELWEGPDWMFKDAISRSHEIAQQLADYGIENQCLNLSKNKMLLERTGRDVMKTVEMNELDKEA